MTKRNREIQIKFRMSEEEAEQLRKKVELSGKSMQEYLLNCALEKPITNTDGIKEIAPELKRVGNNLNQTARALNEIDGALKDSGFYKFSNIDSIYMISPILLGRELKFLESMDFKTNSYKKRELQDDKFVVEHPEARLATHIFGNNKNIGTASIKFETINTPDWQEKCKSKISEFNERGIFLTQEKDK